MNASHRAIVAMNVAGYHADQRARVRLLVESQVSRPIMNQAWADGVRSKEQGVRCECRDCKKGKA